MFHSRHFQVFTRCRFQNVSVRVSFSKSTVFKICRQNLCRFRVNGRPIRRIFHRFQNVPTSCERSLSSSFILFPYNFARDDAFHKRNYASFFHSSNIQATSHKHSYLLGFEGFDRFYVKLRSESSRELQECNVSFKKIGKTLQILKGFNENQTDLCKAMSAQSFENGQKLRLMFKAAPANRQLCASCAQRKSIFINNGFPNTSRAYMRKEKDYFTILMVD